LQCILLDFLQLIEKKKDLVESCRVLIDTLKEKEAEWTFQARKVNNDFEVSIEQEKKAFRAGQEDRLQKVSTVEY
jgi:hypothetical protein